MPAFALTLDRALEVAEPTAVADVRATHHGLDPDTLTDDVVTIAGRVVLARDIGRLKFLVIRDRTGDLQVVASEAGLPERLFSLLDEVDLGDIIGVTGAVGTTRRGSSACSPTGGRCSRRPSDPCRRSGTACRIPISNSAVGTCT